MNIAELKELLKNYPDDTVIRVHSYEHGYVDLKVKYDSTYKLLIIPASG